MPKLTNAKLFVFTPLFIWLSHYCAVLPHEYAHSITAWLVGEMKNPFAIDYGGTSLRNMLLLWNIDENVNYKALFADGHDLHAALIAFAGAGVGNVVLFILCRRLLISKTVLAKPIMYYFIFWLQLMNVGNFYDYVPIRVFSTHGDMGHLVHGLHISAWWVFVIAGYLVAFLICQFFYTTVPTMFTILKIESTGGQGAIIITILLILFGWYGGIMGPVASSDPLSHGDIAYFLEVASCWAIPGLLFVLWPSRAWFKGRLNEIKMARRTT